MELFFYIFALLVVLSSTMVILSRNTVYAALWLIFTFCNASGLMILLGAEFIAMMIIIIYVGAVAVLFLFVIMMLDITPIKVKKPNIPKIIFTLSLLSFLFLDLTIAILSSCRVIISPCSNRLYSISSDVSNINAIGKLLYTEFILPFQVAGVILFVAIISTIILTSRKRYGVKRQNIPRQLSRNKQNSLVKAKLDGKLGLDNLNYGD